MRESHIQQWPQHKPPGSHSRQSSTYVQVNFVESLVWSDHLPLASPGLYWTSGALLSYVKTIKLTFINLQNPYFNNLGVNRHFEGHAGAHWKTQHADPAAEDLWVLLQDFVGRLQQGNVRKQPAVTQRPELEHCVEAWVDFHPYVNCCPHYCRG